MKIDGTSKLYSSTSVKGERQQPTGESATSGPRTSGAKVELSALSSRLHVIEAGLENAQVVDAARVAEIRQAISEGRFRVNPEAVADKLLDAVRELLTTHKA